MDSSYVEYADDMNIVRAGLLLVQVKPCGLVGLVHSHSSLV